MNLELDDQVVVVVGGANGIGQATAQTFLAENARVAIWDKSIEPSLSDERSANFRVDVGDEASIGSAVGSTLARFGRIDHWVHAAAIGSGKFGFPFTNLRPEDWQAVLNVNILGMVRTAHAIAPILQQQRSGTITMIGSVAGQIGSQTDPPYSASKAANINFTQCLAKDLAPHNVRVNIVHPGMVKTELNRAVWQAWHDRQPVDQRLNYDEWALAKIKQLTPLGRWQTPKDIADLIVFLASARAANITGQSLNVDGGWVMRW